MAGPNYSHGELQDLWRAAGGDPLQANVAAAIAEAESGGCQYAKAGPTDDRPAKVCTYRRTNAENSYGLWQINQRAHPQYSAGTLYSAGGNAAAAVAVSRNGADFGPWSTYVSGAYKAHLLALPGVLPSGPPVPASGLSASARHSLSGWHKLSTTLGGGLQQSLTQSGKARRAALRALR